MKHTAYYIWITLLISLTGCRSLDQNTRTFLGIQTGSMIGNVAGAIIGDQIGGYTGSAIGSVLGTAGGAVAGAVITAPRPEREKVRTSSAPAPYLFIDDIFLNDQNGNNRIDAGEKCQLTFIIKNEGERDAYDVTPQLKVVKGGKYLTLSDPVIIRKISPGEAMQYTVAVNASHKLKIGEAGFRIEVKEKNGYNIPGEEFIILTQR